MLFVVFAFCSLFCGFTVCECLTVFVAVVFGCVCYVLSLFGFRLVSVSGLWV